MFDFQVDKKFDYSVTLASQASVDPFGVFHLNGGPYELNDHVQQQLCERWGAPARYLQSLPPGLRAFVSNYHIGNDTRPAIARISETDGSIRAFVSPSYVPFDNRDVLAELSHSLDAGWEPCHGRTYVGQDEMRLSIVNKSNPCFLSGNDRVWPAISLYNNEIGDGSLRIEAAWVREVCSNGLIIMTKRFERYRQAHRWIGRDAFATAVRQAIASSFESLAWAARLAREARRLVVQAVVKPLTPVTESLTTKAYNIVKQSRIGTDKFIERINQRLAHEEYSLFGVTQAMTHVSKEFDIKTQLEIERTAGRVLQLAEEYV